MHASHYPTITDLNLVAQKQDGVPECCSSLQIRTNNGKGIIQTENTVDSAITGFANIIPTREIILVYESEKTTLTTVYAKNSSRNLKR